MKIVSRFQLNLKQNKSKTDILTGSDLIAHLDQISELKDLNASSFLLLTDKIIFSLFGNQLINSLTKLGKPVRTSIIESGENMKDLGEIPHIISPFFDKPFDRNAILVSLGGGVISDIGGFIASILLRGIRHIVIPTTLLSMVDASIGGKTGVNIYIKSKMLKNMLGTFKQPELIITDIDILKSLPENEIKSGLGEILKYRVGWGKPIITKSVTHWMPLISQCQKIKLDIIQKDPFDTLGLREKLNLGHTFGHAFESAAMGKLTHGEAVAFGLIAAAKISTHKGLLKKEIQQKIIKDISSLGFATSIKDIKKQSVLDALKFDKKGSKFVLLKDIGEMITGQKVEENTIKNVLAEIVS